MKKIFKYLIFCFGLRDSRTFALPYPHTPILPHSRTPNPFNLVEIALAIGVIGIGIAGIMALFPVGFQAARDAIGDNYAADSADQFLHYISRACKNDWTVVSGIATSKQYNGDGLEEALTWNYKDQSENHPLIQGSIDYVDSVDNGTPDNYNIFRIIQKSGNIVDFYGTMRIWKSTVKASVYDGSWQQWQDTSYTSGAGLNIEISWPSEKPYAKRQKRYFYLEVFKTI